MNNPYPEYHTFTHIACVPWPHWGKGQMDWVEGITELESWLNMYTGPRWVEWCWAESSLQRYWEISVAFKQPKYKTLCLLRWGT
jgi:hypothetical protein